MAQLLRRLGQREAELANSREDRGFLHPASMHARAPAVQRPANERRRTTSIVASTAGRGVNAVRGTRRPRRSA